MAANPCSEQKLLHTAFSLLANMQKGGRVHAFQYKDGKHNNFVLQDEFDKKNHKVSKCSVSLKISPKVGFIF